MGADLSEVDKIVLSHGHSDHTGGLQDALKLSGGAQIYGHPNIFDEKYSKSRCEQRSIGIPYTKESLEMRGAELHLSRDVMKIAPDIETTGEIHRQTDFETIPERLCVMRNGTLIKDDLQDDLSLIIKGKEGVMVLFGCAHSGAINTLRQVKQMIGDNPITMIAGGIHLMDASEDRINKTIDELKTFQIEKMALCHCTGALAMIKLYQVFGDKMIFNNVGTRFEWN
jgi:7,8-dihydropterin-6-yl-methyl-4-(beta-D-ribofuranosyl)aminobenzene 5'-phosphate synthase